MSLAQIKATRALAAFHRLREVADLFTDMDGLDPNIIYDPPQTDTEDLDEVERILCEAAGYTPSTGRAIGGRAAVENPQPVD